MVLSASKINRRAMEKHVIRTPSHEWRAPTHAINCIQIIDISHALNTNQRRKKLFRKYLVCISISNKK